MVRIRMQRLGRPHRPFYRIAAIEKSYLEGLLEKHKGNVTHSADEAGMTRSALQKLLQKYGRRSSDFREG